MRRTFTAVENVTILIMEEMRMHQYIKEENEMTGSNKMNIGKYQCTSNNKHCGYIFELIYYNPHRPDYCPFCGSLIKNLEE